MIALADTTVWSAAFRRKPASLNPGEKQAATALKQLIQLNGARILGVVRQELLSGMREQGQFDRLRLLLRSFPDVPVDCQDYEEGAAVYNICRGQGMAGSSVDFLICAVAMRRDWPILTLDHDFTGYAACLPVRIYAPTTP